VGVNEFVSDDLRENDPRTMVRFVSNYCS